MIHSDVLSRQKQDDSSPHDIIPISFNMQNILQSKYYNIHEREEGNVLVQTRSKAKSSCTTLPEVHIIDKGIDPNITHEKQVIDKGIDPNMTLEKQVTNPIISSEAKNVSQIKPD